MMRMTSLLLMKIIMFYISLKLGKASLMKSLESLIYLEKDGLVLQKLYQEGILDDSYSRNNPYIVENVTEFYNDLLNYKDVSLDNEAKELYDGLLELAKLCIDSHCKIYLAIE